MTGLAHITGSDVCCTLARRRDAIMATNTGRGSGAVIKARHHPGIHHMTGIAGRRGRYMRRTHTGSNHTIVTTRTGPKHLCVINGGDGYPAHR